MLLLFEQQSGAAEQWSRASSPSESVLKSILASFLAYSSFASTSPKLFLREHSTHHESPYYPVSTDFNNYIVR